MSTVRRVARALGLQTIGGLVVWLIVAAVAVRVDAAVLDVVAVLLLFAQLVVVPLGLLLLDDGATRLEETLVRGGRALFRLGAVAALASLAIPPGQVSAAVAALYLLPTVAIGAASVVRALRGLREGGLGRPVELGRVAAGGFLLVGALLFVFARQGAALGGFHELTLRLAAVHLHYVGFGLVLMAVEVARRRPAFGIGVHFVAAATLVTLAGLRPAGTLLVVLGLVAVAAGTLTTLGRVGPAARRLLFVASIVPLLVGGMAVLQVLNRLTGAAAIPLPVMAGLHGSFAAIGVVFCGLLGWRLAQDR